jgi:hypothetical protein
LVWLVEKVEGGGWRVEVGGVEGGGGVEGRREVEGGVEGREWRVERVEEETYKGSTLYQ